MKLSKVISMLQDLQEKVGDVDMEARNRHGDPGEPELGVEHRWISGEPKSKDVYFVTSEQRPEH